MSLRNVKRNINLSTDTFTSLPTGWGRWHRQSLPRPFSTIKDKAELKKDVWFENLEDFPPGENIARTTTGIGHPEINLSWQKIWGFKVFLHKQEDRKALKRHIRQAASYFHQVFKLLTRIASLPNFCKSCTLTWASSNCFQQQFTDLCPSRIGSDGREVSRRLRAGMWM